MSPPLLLFRFIPPKLENSARITRTWRANLLNLSLVGCWVHWTPQLWYLDHQWDPGHAFLGERILYQWQRQHWPSECHLLCRLPSSQSSAGTFFGSLTAAPLADFIDRRLGLIASTAVFTFGVTLQTAATALPMFIAGRFFAGYGVGLISALSEDSDAVLGWAQLLRLTAVSLYQSENAPKWIRGVIVGSYQLSITIGLLLTSIVNNATHNR